MLEGKGGQGSRFRRKLVSVVLSHGGEHWVIVVSHQTNVLTKSGSIHYLHCGGTHDKVFQWLWKRDPWTNIFVLLRSGLKGFKMSPSTQGSD